MKKHIDLTNVLASLALALTLTYGLFEQPDPRGVMIFCLFISLSEIFVYLRWRSFVVCKLCGFDPILYKKTPEMAALRVREFYQRQAQNPSFLLSKSPLLELHRQQLERERRQRKFEAITKASSAIASPGKAPVVSPGKEVST